MILSAKRSTILADAIQVRIRPVDQLVPRDRWRSRDSLPKVVPFQQLELRPGPYHERLAILVAHLDASVAGNRRRITIAAEPLSDAKWLRGQTTVPIALNESVTDPASVLEILRENAAAFILPDTHIAGGILPCVTIGRICEAANIPCIMHCGHDLGPKTAAMLHVAAACPAYSLANDSTYYGLEDDIITERLQIDRGTITVSEQPGLRIEGDPQRIARYKVDC